MPFFVKMPKLSPTMEQGTIVKWHIKEGDFAKTDQLLVEVGTDKATIEYNVLDAGFLRKILVTEGKDAKVNDPIAIFTESKDEAIEGFSKEATEELKPKAQATTSAPSQVSEQTTVKKEDSLKPVGNGQGKVFASPLARRLAKEKGINLEGMTGSGPQGRVMSRDLESLKPASYADSEAKESSLSIIRQVIARRLLEAKQTIPHFYIVQEVDAEPLTAVREQLKEGGIKVSINDLIIKATAFALREHPIVNSGFNVQKMAVLNHGSIDISVAVDTKEGVITPIVKNADQKTIVEISSSMHELGKRAKEGRLKPEEFQGGSFTISNLGMFGTSEFTAIINPPQTAILAVGAAIVCPVVKEGHIVVGKRLKMTLSCDHRVIDGAVAARFLQTLKHYLENPALLLEVIEG